MPLYEANFETSSGSYGKGHKIIIEAASIKQATLDALRWMRDRQNVVEPSIAEANADDPDYRPYYGKLHFMKVHGWAPHVVDAEGHLQSSESYGGAGFFEWKIDGAAAGFTPEQWIELKLTPEVLGEPGEFVIIDHHNYVYGTEGSFIPSHLSRWRTDKPRKFKTRRGAQRVASKHARTKVVELDSEGRTPA